MTNEELAAFMDKHFGSQYQATALALRKLLSENEQLRKVIKELNERLDKK